MPHQTPETPPWFRVLKAARKLSPRDTHHFTAVQLAAEAEIESTIDPKTGKVISRGSQIASAWLSKFVRWGYVDFVEKIDAGGIRPTNSYVLTKVGRKCEVTEGCPSKLTRLIEAVQVFEKARRTRNEEDAYAALIQVSIEVLPNKPVEEEEE
jgi:hypothetical protein